MTDITKIQKQGTIDMPTQEKKSLNLYEKLIEVRKQVVYIQKNTKAYNYDYVTGSDILGAIRPKMDEVGVLLVPDMESFELIKFKKGNGEAQIPMVKISYTWINAEKPDERITTTATYFEDKMSGCQSIGAIQTYAERYFLAKFFQIATGKDDIEQFYDKNGLSATEVTVVVPQEPPIEEIPEQKPKFTLTIEECRLHGQTIWTKMRERSLNLPEKMVSEFAYFMLNIQREHPDFSVLAKWENQTPDPEKTVPAMYEWASTRDGDMFIELIRRAEYTKQVADGKVRVA